MPTMKSLLKRSKRKQRVKQDSNNHGKLQEAAGGVTTKAQQQQQQQRHAKETSGSVIGLVLGGGSFSHCHVDGTTISSLLFHHWNNKAPRSQSSLHSHSSSTMAGSLSSGTTTSRAAQRFLRHSSSFLRVADLNLASPALLDDTLSIASGETAISSSSISSNMAEAANFAYAAVNPPPGVDHDPLERWVALDDGAGSHAPIAPMAVQALAKAGLDAALDRGMWTPHTSSRCFKATPWHLFTWPAPGEPATIPKDELPAPGAKHEDTVLLWTGKFQHGFYGSELPAVRAVGIIPAAPQVLFDLLIDSERVKEYNKLSLGREDLLVLQDNLHQDGPFGKSVTKVMRSKSNPPLVRQAMQFVSMLHAQELEDGSGYLIVTRAVTHPDDDRSDTSVLRSEILLGVNVIRRIQGDPDRCVMVNMIHLRSPMVPMMIANRIGASAAANFIRDLRGAFC